MKKYTMPFVFKRYFLKIENIFIYLKLDFFLFLDNFYIIISKIILNKKTLPKQNPPHL